MTDAQPRASGTASATTPSRASCVRDARRMQSPGKQSDRDERGDDARTAERQRDCQQCARRSQCERRAPTRRGRPGTGHEDRKRQLQEHRGFVGVGQRSRGARDVANRDAAVVDRREPGLDEWDAYGLGDGDDGGGETTQGQRFKDQAPAAVAAANLVHRPDQERPTGWSNERVDGLGLTGSGGEG